jgi:hypothetical protein
MPNQTFTTPTPGSPSGLPIGQRTLKDLVDTFLPDIYPTVTIMKGTPTSVDVYGIVKDAEPSDPRIGTVLDSLTFSDLLELLAKYKFKVTKYVSGTPKTPVVYTVAGKSSDATDVGSLSMDAIVGLLASIAFNVSTDGGTPKPYTIKGKVENDVESNPHLSQPIGKFTAKYVFLLKHLYRFSVTENTSGVVFEVNSDGNKTNHE